MDNKRGDEMGLIDLESKDAEDQNIAGNNGSVSHSERQWQSMEPKAYAGESPTSGGADQEE